jgi:hypothetical protein
MQNSSHEVLFGSARRTSKKQEGVREQARGWSESLQDTDARVRGSEIDADSRGRHVEQEIVL